MAMNKLTSQLNINMDGSLLEKVKYWVILRVITYDLSALIKSKGVKSQYMQHTKIKNRRKDRNLGSMCCYA
jgi:hypothetical protein